MTLNRFWIPPNPCIHGCRVKAIKDWPQIIRNRKLMLPHYRIDCRHLHIGIDIMTSARPNDANLRIKHRIRIIIRQVKIASDAFPFPPDRVANPALEYNYHRSAHKCITGRIQCGSH
ncbi:hypothetical protein CDAR_101071 [Caerostris darwini]|uniref:Uncharacterized protein n=1 Tax=Caerostris darwini TaxID=1538125 RepID=A0AAV4QG74_9ARAC|nr:hypothetical protein CDAR_101071 [Caerostris darwini]